jgi:protein involved in temperature-dependent protein secretion
MSELESIDSLPLKASKVKGIVRKVFILSRHTEEEARCIDLGWFRDQNDIKLVSNISMAEMEHCLYRKTIRVLSFRDSAMYGEPMMLSLLLFGAESITAAVPLVPEDRLEKITELRKAEFKKNFDAVEKQLREINNIELPKIVITYGTSLHQMRFIVTVDPPGTQGFSLYSKTFIATSEELATMNVVRDFTKQPQE